MSETTTSREQSVSLLELFYDLIFVYAISQVTGIFRTGFTLDTVFHYVMATFVVLQAWMYLTNYINRFGKERRYENAALVINMCAAIVMANTVGTNWISDPASTNWALFVMLGTVSVLYALRARESGDSCTMARYSLRTLLPVCGIYLLVAVASPVLDPNMVAVLDTAAILWGIFGPAAVAGRYDLPLSMISFSHLVERFELITIITFGEAVVTIAEVFGLSGFTLDSLMTYLCVVGMFGCYVVLVHQLTDHNRQHRGLRLIYCHFFVVMSINLFTVAINLLRDNPTPTLVVCTIAAISQLVFFVSLSMLMYYHRDDVVFGKGERLACLAALVAGMALTFAGAYGGLVVFLAGPLLTQCICLCVLRRKDLALAA